MKVEYRKTWKNHTGNQTVQPLRLCRPESLDDAVALVQEAERCSATVRAVGSGHSWSDVALTTGFLVDTSGLSRVLDQGPNLLRAGVNAAELVYTEAGIRIRELNAHLDSRGLALSNMGGYDGQTIAGVISTSTHGSGITFGPLSDMIRSLDLVAGGGMVYRIEPDNGPTDPNAFQARHPERTLIQDDRRFHAVSVGMGSMGIIYGVTLKVEPKYWLKEVRALSTWSQVKTDLHAGDVLSQNRHYEVYFNPYRVRGDNLCLVTTRNRTSPPQGRPRDKAERNALVEIAASLPFAQDVLTALINLDPKGTPDIIDRALEGLVDDEYTNLSYKVFNIGAANDVPAYSAEIGVPVDPAGRHIQAVERIMAIAEERRRLGQIYQTSPVALRFVKASDAYMSMMYGRDTMMIELIMLAETKGGFELLAAHEEALYELSGRPHWGQINSLTGSHDFLRSMYPRYEDWLAVRRELDPRGTFDSPFTKRVGISGRPFAP